MMSTLFAWERALMPTNELHKFTNEAGSEYFILNCNTLGKDIVSGVVARYFYVRMSHSLLLYSKKL